MRGRPERQAARSDGTMVMQSDVAADFDRLAVYYDLEHHDITDDLPVLTEFARASPGPILELPAAPAACCRRWRRPDSRL